MSRTGGGELRLGFALLARRSFAVVDDGAVTGAGCFEGFFVVIAQGLADERAAIGMSRAEGEVDRPGGQRAAAVQHGRHAGRERAAGGVRGALVATEVEQGGGGEVLVVDAREAVGFFVSDGVP